MTRFFLLAASLALAGCAESDDAALVPIEENESFNKIDPVEAAAAADERALSLGEWSLATEGERPALQFGPAGTAPQFSLRCDDRGGLLLLRHGVAPTGEAEMMTVTLGTSSRRLAVNPVAGMVPLLRAAIPASDELSGQLAAAAQPITVAVGDAPPLNLPPSPLIEDYINSCSGEDAAPEPAADAEGEGNSAEPQR